MKSQLQRYILQALPFKVLASLRIQNSYIDQGETHRKLQEQMIWSHCFRNLILLQISTWRSYTSCPRSSLITELVLPIAMRQVVLSCIFSPKQRVISSDFYFQTDLLKFLNTIKQKGKHSWLQTVRHQYYTWKPLCLQSMWHEMMNDSPEFSMIGKDRQRIRMGRESNGKLLFVSF